MEEDTEAINNSQASPPLRRSRRKRHATSWTRVKRKHMKPMTNNDLPSPPNSPIDYSCPSAEIQHPNLTTINHNNTKESVWSALTSGANPPDKIERGEVSITLVRNSNVQKIDKPKYSEPFTFHPSMFQMLPAVSEGAKDSSVTITRQKVQPTAPQVAVNSEHNERTPGELLRNDHEIQPVVCKCWHGCSTKITESQRQTMFKHFWSLDSNGRLKFLLDHMFEMRKKRTHIRPNGLPSRRKYSCEYYLDADGHRFQVCLNYFVKTLDISVNMVRMLMKNRRGDNQCEDFEEEISEPYMNPVTSIAQLPLLISPQYLMETTIQDIFDNELPPPVDINEFLEVVLVESALPFVLPAETKTDHPVIQQPLPPPSSEMNYSMVPFEHSAFFSNNNLMMPEEENLGLEPVDCHCWNQCPSKITEKQRQEIFDHFWNLESFTLRRQYLLNHVVDKKKRCMRSPKGRQSRRQYTCEYYLNAGGDKIQVCQRFFVKTLGISGSLVHLTLRKKRTFGAEMAGIDRRGLWRTLQADKERQRLNQMKHNGIVVPNGITMKEQQPQQQPKIPNNKILQGIQIRGTVDSFMIKPPISIIPISTPQGVMV